MATKELNSLLFDKRVSQRMVTEGKISQDELEKHLKNLPDQEKNCEDMAEEGLVGSARTAKSNGTVH